MESRLLDLIDELYSAIAQFSYNDMTPTCGGHQDKGFSPAGDWS